MSLYPLVEGAVAEIIEFIRELRSQERIDVVSNQLSTQLRGEFDDVTGAINRCLKLAMEKPHTVVLIVKYLNVSPDLARAPSLTPP